MIALQHRLTAVMQSSSTTCSTTCNVDQEPTSIDLRRRQHYPVSGPSAFRAVSPASALGHEQAPLSPAVHFGSGHHLLPATLLSLQQMATEARRPHPCPLGLLAGEARQRADVRGQALGLVAGQRAGHADRLCAVLTAATGRGQGVPSRVAAGGVPA